MLHGAGELSARERRARAMRIRRAFIGHRPVDDVDRRHALDWSSRLSDKFGGAVIVGVGHLGILATIFAQHPSTALAITLWWGGFTISFLLWVAGVSFAWVARRWRADFGPPLRLTDSEL
jgi:hypothetical protein